MKGIEDRILEEIEGNNFTAEELGLGLDVFFSYRFAWIAKGDEERAASDEDHRSTNTDEVEDRWV